MRHPHTLTPNPVGTTTPASDWFTLTEAARYAGLAYSTVRRYRIEGLLPSAVRVDRAWRVHRADLDALMVDGPSLTADAAADVIDRLLDTAADDLPADELDALRRRVADRLDALGGAA